MKRRRGGSLFLVLTRDEQTVALLDRRIPAQSGDILETRGVPVTNGEREGAQKEGPGAPACEAIPYASTGPP